MLRGIYTATSGMLTAQRDINVRGNNLANLSTAGFKADRLVATTFAEALAIRQGTRTTGEKTDILGTKQPFDEYGEPILNDDGEPLIVPVMLSRNRTALETMTDFSQGGLEQTLRSVDFAIAGEGFFVIQSSRGEFDAEENPQGVHGGVYYTRNGQFQISEDGYLITGLGDFVLDDFGDQIWVGTDNFIVGEAGDIYVANADGDYEHFARFGIYNPENPHLLFKNREDIFTLLNEDFEPEALEFTGSIMQGYTERSNTDVAAEMAGMMTASRSFQSMSQILKAIDAALAKSINEVARV